MIHGGGSGGLALLIMLVTLFAMLGLGIRILHIFFAGYGNWKRTFRCKSCGYMSTWSHEFVPCGGCGSLKTPDTLIARQKFFGGYDIKGEGEHG